MKPILKRPISFALVCLLLISLFVPAFGAAKQTPVIVVSGMASFPTYAGAIAEENRVWPPQTDAILRAVGKTLLPLAKAAAKRDLNVLADETFDMIYTDLFEIVACDETGEPLHDLQVPQFEESADHYPKEILQSDKTEDEVAVLKTLCDAIGAENVYFFNYDWRLDPTAHVKPLREMIERVIRETGAKAVTLVPCSMGGTVVNSYLNTYGGAGIEKIVYCLVASKGLDLVGELFNNRVSIQTKVLTERLFNFENGNVLAQFLLGALKTVTDSTPLLEQAVDKLVARILESIGERGYREVLARSFATMPGLWAFCPDDYYESAKHTMFPNGGNKTFIEKIDTYHYNVQNEAEALMQKAKSGGTAIYVTASYGFVGFPTTDAAFVQSDCLIETHNESFGAIAAPYGQTLGEGYKAMGTVCADGAHLHLSTDGIVDASTCAFPEQTWFIKHMKHIGFPYGSEAAELLVWLVCAEQEVDVRSNEKYPQFTDLNAVTGKLTSLTGNQIQTDPLDQISGLYTRFLKFLYDLRDLFAVRIQTLQTGAAALAK